MDEVHFKRFCAKVAMPETPDGCMEWIAGKFPSGYGCFNAGDSNHSQRSHRASYEHFVGPIPEGLMVLHNCDNPGCVRPDHLRVGTHADNTRDKNERNRNATGDKNGTRRHPEKLARGDMHHARLHPERMSRGETHYSRLTPEKLARGEKNKASKLTEQDVIQIRSLFSAGGVTYSDLARQYGVERPSITRVIKRETWNHVI